MFDVYMPPMKVRLSHRRSRRDGDVVFCVGSYPNRKFSRYSQSTLGIIGPFEDPIPAIQVQSLPLEGPRSLG